MLKLICGPSGSGKTDRLTDAIRKDIEAGIRCYLLVPEQQAYISERDLPPCLPANAGLFFEIVHFSSLAEDVFHQYGGLNRPSLHGGLRSLLLWDVLRSTADMLSVYGQSAKNDSTLTVLMQKTLDELRANGITSDDLERAASSLAPGTPLRDKLTDIALVEAQYRYRLEQRFGTDPSDRLMQVANLLKEHAFFADSHVYVDSFTGFTVPEYAVLGEMIRQADKVTVTLCADGFASKLPHFKTVIETAKHLQKLADQANANLEKETLSCEETGKNKALSALERNLWNFHAEPLREEEKCIVSPVQFLSAGNIYEEAEAAALHIAGLHLDDVPYGKIAVFVRNTEDYAGILNTAMERYSIPFFFSERTEFSSKPLFRLILSALRIVARGFAVQDVITLVKTGLAGVSRRDGALFEEYCETWHITGSRFFDELWSMNPDGLTVDRSPRAEEILEQANRVRKTVIEPLLRLQAEFRQSVAVVDRAAALYRYLNDLDVANQLSELAREELSAGRRREAGETVRLYRLVEEALTDLCKILPDAEMTVDEFSSAIRLLLSDTDLGSVPNVQDCVIVGSAATLRVENVDAALLLGLNEGVFPRSISDNGILSDGEKEILEELGISIASRERTQSSEELLYVYRAVSKPKNSLYLSYISHQKDGSPATPSLAFTRALHLLGQKAEPFSIDAVRMTRSIRERTVPSRTLPPRQDGTILRLSQSKISAFVACPYRYFATYTLDLREKKDSRPSYACDGTFLHYIFEHFLSEACREDGSFVLPAPEDANRIADEIIERFLSEVYPLPPEYVEGTVLHIFSRLRKLAQTMLVDIMEEIRQSDFVPSFFEQTIGGKGENDLPSVSIPLANGSIVKLSGKVDRVDLLRKNNEVFVRIVDYKTGNHDFRLADVRSGSDIQLILYLFAVVRSGKGNFKPAGAELIVAQNVSGSVSVARRGVALSDPEIQGSLDRSEGAYFTKRLIRQSMEEICELEAQMNEAVSAIATRILQGDVKKTPSKKACAFCRIAAHCDQAVQG